MISGWACAMKVKRGSGKGTTRLGAGAAPSSAFSFVALGDTRPMIWQGAVSKVSQICDTFIHRLNHGRDIKLQPLNPKQRTR
jgi:hypothetical protein